MTIFTQNFKGLDYGLTLVCFTQHKQLFIQEITSDKLIAPRLLNQFSIFYVTRNIITALTRTIHVSSSWTRSIKSKLFHPTSLRSILILLSHLRLVIGSYLFSLGFPNKILYAFILSSVRATCTAHRILIDLITWIIIIIIISWSSLLYSLLQFPPL